MLEQFPQPLKEARRWVCFDAAKTPINPATGKNAMPNEPSTWGTLAAAQAAVTRYGLRGVGVLLGDGLCGIDIDHCRDPATGALSDMAVQIIARMDSYTEASPSGTGVHILFTGTKPAGPCRKSSIGLEMYDGGRYFTVTGNVLEAKAIAERTEACAAVHAQYLAKPEPAGAPAPAVVWQAVDRSDEEILHTACSAKDGERFAALYAGSWQAYYASHSEADLSFCNLLAFWFAADKARMDRVFRASGLMRPKWDQRRGAKTYGDATLDRAVADCQEVYTPPPQTADGGPAFADQDEALRALNAKYTGVGRERAPASAPAPASRATPWTTPATPAASVTGTPTACATTPPTSAGWCGTAPAGSGTTWPPSSALQTRCWIRWTRPALASVIPTTPPPSADTSRKAAPAGARRPFSRRPSTCRHPHAAGAVRPEPGPAERAKRHPGSGPPQAAAP